MLTRKRAIELSIELWTWLAEMGKEKIDWPGWERNGGQVREVVDMCFLCDYSQGCNMCPYQTKYGYTCCGDKSPFKKWADSSSEKTKKKYARQFLKQLKALLKEV